MEVALVLKQGLKLMFGTATLLKFEFGVGTRKRLEWQMLAGLDPRVRVGVVLGAVLRAGFGDGDYLITLRS
jgi:hypothetical protein